MPLSWDVYVYGMAYVRRSDLREMLRIAEAVRAAGAVEESYDPWRTYLRDEEQRGLMAKSGNIIQRILRLVFDRNAARKAEGDAKKSVGVIDKTFGGLKKSVVAVGAAVAAAFAFRKIIAGVKELGRAFIEQEAIWNRLSGTLATVGVNFDDVEGQIRASARAMQDTTTIGDEQFAETMQTLVAISGDYAKSLENVGVVADLSAGLQIDMATSAQLVGRAMAGQTQTLTRYGIIVEKGADAVETIRKNFKGLAENESRTLSGRLKQLTNEWDDFKQILGEFLVEGTNAPEIIREITAALKDMAAWLEQHKDAATKFGELLTASFEKSRRSVEALETAFINAEIAYLRFRNSFSLLAEDRARRKQEIATLELRKTQIELAQAQRELDALIERQKGKATPLGKPRPTAAPDAAATADALKAQREEIANLVKLNELGLLNEAGKDRLLEIETQLHRELQANLDAEIPDLEKRLQIAQDLLAAEKATVNIRMERRDLIARVPTPAVTTTPSVPSMRDTVRLDSEIDAMREKQRLAGEELLDQFAREEEAAMHAAMIMTNAFESFFEALFDSSRNAGGALVAALMEGLAQYLEVRAAAAFAEALFPPNPAALAQGIAFSAAAGAARALEASLGRRSGGGSSVGALSSGGASVGSNRSTTQPSPEITLVLQGDFDALNPKFVRAVDTARREGIQTIGSGNVRLRTVSRG